MAYKSNPYGPPSLRTIRWLGKKAAQNTKESAQHIPQHRNQANRPSVNIKTDGCALCTIHFLSIYTTEGG